ncbi:hypothetical protein HY837_04740 [archaeon]|nr:hypothetical protein [archaeon]
MEDWQKEFREERAFLRNLVVASGIIRWPTPEEFILSELVNGVISYTGGNAGKFKYQNVFMDRTSYEYKMYNYFKEELKNSKKELLADLNATIDRLVKPHQVHCPPDRPYDECNIYSSWKGICPVLMQSSFSLPYDFVINAKKDVRKLDEYTRKEIKSIGKAMKPFVEEDLEYIKSKYHW